MRTMDQTGTLWLILMTPKKNLLAKVSSLKKFGKIKIDEWKVLYGRKGVGGWIFQILGQPTSRTFSFHDGEVVQKTTRGYLPLRKHGVRLYLILGLVFIFWMCTWTTYSFFTNPIVVHEKPVEKSQTLPKKMIEEPSKEKKIEQPARSVDPQAHEHFLEAKREFQYGRMSASLKILQQNMAGFDDADQKAASQMISEMFFLQCEKWRGQHEERKAVIACEKTLTYGAHARADVFLNAQEEKARQYYLEGYTAVKFNPAVAKQKFARVLQSAKTKSTWRNKAQYQLRKISK